MGTWGTGIFSDDLASDVRHEYGILLSTGLSNEQTEKMLFDYFVANPGCDAADEDIFWLSLSFCEWKRGRLSPHVKEKALEVIDSSRELERWHATGNAKEYKERKKVLQTLRKMLVSPMPPANKVRKPQVIRCPWKVGSLLAYKIGTNHPYLDGRRCNGKYVLLRIINVHRRPISSIFNTGYYDESMLVALYNWVGNEIPDPKIVDELQYISIERKETMPKLPTNLQDHIDAQQNTNVKAALVSFLNKQPEKYVWLDWRCSRGQENPITFLNRDDDFETKWSELFREKPGSSIYTHSIPFDLSLSKIFEPHLAAQSANESVIIPE